MSGLIGQGDDGSGGVQSPANYILNDITLFRQGLDGQDLGREGLQIKTLAREIKINESIYKNALNVDIRIMDSLKLLNTLRMNGTEKILLDISRTTDSNIERFKLNLILSDIDLLTEVTPSGQSYVLKCVPEYAFINQTKTISDFFDNIVEAIRKICQGDLKIPNHKLDQELKSIPSIVIGDAFNESNRFVKLPEVSIDGVYPKMKPLSVINWLVRNLSDEGTPLYFYQTSDGTVRLRSYKTMLKTNYSDFDNDSKGRPFSNAGFINYYGVNSTLKDASKDLFQNEKMTILKVNQPSSLSAVKNIANGTYASNLYTIDIAKKEYKFKNNFEYKNMETLNKEKPFSDKVKIGDNKLTDNVSAKNYYLNINKDAFESLERQGQFLSSSNVGFNEALNTFEDITDNPNHNRNYHSAVVNDIQKKEAYHGILDSQVIDLTIPGNFHIRTGQVINLEILSHKENRIVHADDDTDKVDAMLSGRFLVTSLEHVFTEQTHIVKLKVKRDSFDVDMNEPELKKFKNEEVKA